MIDDDTALRELLRRATPDLGSLLPPDDLAPPCRPQRRTPIAVGTVIVAVTAVAIVIASLQQSGPDKHPGPAGPSQTTSTRSSEPPSSAGHPLTVEIRLDQTTIKAGDPISGVAIVTNTSGHSLVITTCLHTWLQVGLTNATVTPEPGWLLCRDAHGTSIPAGTTRDPITVGTTYDRCTDGTPTADTPKCLQEGKRAAPPPLPPGNYTTTAFMLTPAGVRVPTPEAVHVTLTK